MAVYAATILEPNGRKVHVERGRRYYLYAKKPGSQRWLPVNHQTATTTNRKIHAAIYEASDDNAIDLLVNAPRELQKVNPFWRFKLVEVK